MANEVVGGIVRNGVVELDEPLPEGMRVDVTRSTRSLDFTPEERAEFEAWGRLSSEALARFERSLLEQEARNET